MCVLAQITPASHLQHRSDSYEHRWGSPAAEGRPRVFGVNLMVSTLEETSRRAAGSTLGQPDVALVVLC